MANLNPLCAIASLRHCVKISVKAPAAFFLARHSAIVILAVFAAVGLVALDDYGYAVDERAMAYRTSLF